MRRWRGSVLSERVVRAVVALLCAVVPFIVSIPRASAGVGLSAVPIFPSSVTVGQASLAGSLVITNASTAPQTTGSVTLSQIRFVPACGVATAGVDCPAASADPGVFQLSATGTGAAGSACAGVTFTIAVSNPVTGQVAFSSPGPVVLGPPATAAATCTINFGFNVLKAPTKDAQLATAGIQTAQLGSAVATHTDTSTGTAMGTSVTTVAPAPTLKGYSPMVPVRICDTRVGSSPNQCTGNGSYVGTLGKGAILVGVAGAHGVPSTAIAAVLNVTATGTTADSYLTVWPNGVAQPLASNLNWVAGQTVPNLVEVALGAGGAVKVYNNAGATDVVIDLEGYVDSSAPGLFNPLPPARICDSRAVRPDVVANGCQSAGGGAGTLGVGNIIVTVTGKGGVPAGATAAVLNVTATDTTGFGFLTVWPDGSARPLASNLNWVPGQTVPNRVIVPLGPGGKIDVYNSAGATDVVIDVNGYYGPAAGVTGYIPLTPVRTCDTRPVSAQVALNGCNDPANGGPGPLGPGDEGTLTVPAGLAATVFNVTVTNTTDSSYMTVFPDTTPTVFVTPPLASDLNWKPGQTVANLVVVASGQRTVTFYNNAGFTDLVVDVEGVYSTTPTPTPTAGPVPSAAAGASAAVSLRVRHTGTR